MEPPPNGAMLIIPRHGAFQRLNHWLTAALFVLLAVSGMAMYHPGFFFLSALFGGGTSAREIHPWLGIALAASFFVLAMPMVLHNIWNCDDLRWMLRFWRVATNRHDGLPDLGKYNAGQKGVYWTLAGLIPVLLISGILAWEEYFGGWTSIPTQRKALLVHSVAAVIAITIIIVHIYAAIWIKGTMRAMLRGYVTGGWAWLHHRKWLRDTLVRATEAQPVNAGIREPDRD
jgi:formate dehydrogenase subunit gamma